jgi:hypothetical protein
LYFLWTERALSFSILSCQLEFRYHFSCFSTYMFHRYAISSAILAVVATHLALAQVSLAALRQEIRKRIWLEVVAAGRPETRGWVARSAPPVPEFRPDGPNIAMSMPNGASNSGYVRMACGSSPAPRTTSSPC